MFGEFMGGGRRGGRSATRGADLRYNLEISLEQAFTGTKTTISLATGVNCEICK
jgi:molecular chaperone DnaJ